MNARQFEIGEQVTFRHRGTTQTGRIVGQELVDDRRRRPGWHYFVKADHQILDLHESQMGCIVGEVACVS